MDLKDIKIELRPHIAMERKLVGGAVMEFPVDFKQCYVMANGKQVAWYCGTKDQPNKYLSFIEQQPPQVQKEIADQVAKITGGVGNYNAPPSDEHEVINDDE